MAQIDFTPMQAAPAVNAAKLPTIDFKPAGINFRPLKEEGVVAEVGRREGRQLSDIGRSLKTAVKTPFRKDASPGPELLQRIGAAGAKVASVAGDVLNVPFTPFQAGLETGINRVAKGVGGEPKNPEALEKAVQDTAGLATAAAFAPSAKPAGKKSLAATDKVVAKVDQAAQPVRKLLAPSDVSQAAARTAAVKRKTVGEATRDTKASIEALAPYEKRFDAMTPEERTGFAHYMENYSKPEAVKAALPADLKDAAKVLRQGYELRAAKLKDTKSLKDTGLIEDYLNRNATWDNPAKRERFSQIMFGKQGRGGNVKARKYPTYEEFVKAVHESGGRLADENFGRSAALYYANMDNYIAHNRAFDLLRADKVIKYGPENGRGKVPEGWVPLQGRLAVRDVTTKQGAHFRMQAYAPEDVARVYNNFLSKDILGRDVAGGMQKARRVLNTVTAIELGLTNMWHAGIVYTGAVSRDLAKGTRQLLTPGLRGKGAKSIVLSPLAGERLAQVGAKYHKQYLKLTDDPKAEKLVSLATKANAMQTKRPAYMNMAGPKIYEDIFSEGKLAPLDGEARKFGARFGRAMQKMSSSMFDKWIPEIKTGATIERLQLWLEQHPNATDKEAEEYVIKLGDSMDNSFGEMMRDNLFWHKTLRNALQTGFISFSWVAGAMRMAGGAAKETYQTARSGKELGPNAEYLMANVVTAAVAASVYQYLHTGQLPQEPKDLLWPKTGGMQHVGRATVAERASLPIGHWNQFAEYLHDPLQELANEGNIGAKVFWDLLNNRDYRGMPIAKPWALWSDAYLKETGDALWRYGRFIGGSALTPIAISNYMRRNAGTGITPQETIGMAARPAPAFITSPETVGKGERKGAQKQWKAKLKSDARLKGRLESNKKAAPAINFTPAQSSPQVNLP